eukprot:3018936-Rhodomonas_salina.1
MPSWTKSAIDGGQSGHISSTRLAMPRYFHRWWQRALTLQRVPKVPNERPSDFVMHCVLRAV